MKDRHDKRTLDLFTSSSSDEITASEEQMRRQFEDWAQGRVVCTIDDVQVWGLVVKDESGPVYTHPQYGHEMILREPRPRKFV